jgi:hypothetical protein
MPLYQNTERKTLTNIPSKYLHFWNLNENAVNYFILKKVQSVNYAQLMDIPLKATVALLRILKTFLS